MRSTEQQPGNPDMGTIFVEGKRVMEELLDTATVAKFLRVQPSTIRKWVHYGFMPYVKLGRAVRFDPKEVESWVKERKRAGRTAWAPEVRCDKFR
jgi:excisionase family DNA binding protein